MMTSRCNSRVVLQILFSTALSATTGACLNLNRCWGRRNNISYKIFGLPSPALSLNDCCKSHLYTSVRYHKSGLETTLSKNTAKYSISGSGANLYQYQQQGIAMVFCDSNGFWAQKNIAYSLEITIQLIIFATFCENRSRKKL